MTDEERSRLRDKFATHAISGILANQKILRDFDQHRPAREETIQEAAASAYAVADAMLRAREVAPKP